MLLLLQGSIDDIHPEKILEQFWLELAENSKALDNFSSCSLHSTYSPSLMQWLAAVEKFSFSPPEIAHHRYQLIMQIIKT
jgi:hypothetical protein